MTVVHFKLSRKPKRPNHRDCRPLWASRKQKRLNHRDCHHFGPSNKQKRPNHRDCRPLFFWRRRCSREFKPFSKVLELHALSLRNLQKLIVNLRPKFTSTADPYYSDQLFGQIFDPGPPPFFCPSQKDGVLAPPEFHIFHRSVLFSEVRPWLCGRSPGNC